MKLILNLYLLKIGFSLTPHHLPNGKLIKFIPNKEFSKDLYAIKPKEASLISKNWLENIVLDVMNTKPKDNNFIKKDIFEYNDLHIVNSINKLESYIQEMNTDSGNTILSIKWSPMGMHGRQEILFIVIFYLVNESNELIIKEIIQSPFWDPSQIDSKYLKQAIIEYSNNTNSTVNFNYLYDNNLRYKLAWSIWEI